MKQVEKIIVAGGCFWGVEHYYSLVKGIEATKCGYVNSLKENITYQETCSQKYKAIEAVELTYDESPRWSTHKDDVAWTDSEGNVFRYFDYAFLVKRGFFWSLMNYLPISHNTTKMMFERYFKERFPDKFFISVDEFDD